MTQGAEVAVELWREDGTVFRMHSSRPLFTIGNKANPNDVRLSLNEPQAKDLGFGVYFERTKTPRWEITVGDAAEAEVGGDVPIKSLPCGKRCTKEEARRLFPMICQKPGWEGATLHLVLIAHVKE